MTIKEDERISLYETLIAKARADRAQTITVMTQLPDGGELGVDVTVSWLQGRVQSLRNAC